MIRLNVHESHYRDIRKAIDSAKWTASSCALEADELGNHDLAVTYRQRAQDFSHLGTLLDGQAFLQRVRNGVY